jgi:6-pyruvoyltetrahydropterin/6-carboxytetrahydropterin synthase
MEIISTNSQVLGNQMKNTQNNVFELSQRFYFEAAHTLNRSYETEGSLRIHGHTYEAEITLKGSPDPMTGMIVDLGLLREEIDRVRSMLDHRFLDEINDLGPATLENLTVFICNQIEKKFSNLCSVMVERRVSGDRCVLRRE